jgi:hypothetical protein
VQLKRFSFGTASTGDGFAAKSSFTRIVRKTYRNFASRLICIDLDGGQGADRVIGLVPTSACCASDGLFHLSG